MIDNQNVNIIHGDQLERFYESIDIVIDIDDLEKSSDALRNLFPATESFNWEIFLKRLLGLDDFAENRLFNEKFTKELIKNID
jgi:hypothetical protein